jgi:hypothetical protein
LKSKYGEGWTDASLYANNESTGTVVSAKLIEKEGQTVAIVEIA